MAVFLLIVISIPVTGMLWAFWADRRLKKLQAAPWKRIVLAGMVLVNVAAFAWLLLGRIYGWQTSVPLLLLVSAFVWHMVVLPLVLLLTIALLTGEGVVWASRKLKAGTAARVESAKPESDDVAARVALSRRQMLAAGVMGVPVALQAGAVARAMTQLDEFRIREITVALPQLPKALQGLTIAHVTDTHVGRFTHGETIERIVRRVNELDADLVLHTGDLINDALSDLPVAADMMSRLRGKLGTYIVEGNHDLFESRSAFASGLRERGVNLLTNEAATIAVADAKVQLLGLCWGPRTVEDVRTSRGRGAMLDEHMADVEKLRDPDAFQILLAHHPHAFDNALAKSIPLTLGGHTHGGQINFVEGIGPATGSYKYITGLYERVNALGLKSACVIGNGTGNWFPLRINAPAEVIKITLARA
ncbi:MAG TPA: metallophosphoesterase [Phycisphaerales bacterium]|nr:metallophosphoesterase [Phycisphaerales bacterium]